MKYLLSIFVCAFLFSGCVGLHLPLTDHATAPVSKERQNQGQARNPGDGSSPGKKAAPSFPTIESTRASFTETACLDRF